MHSTSCRLVLCLATQMLSIRSVLLRVHFCFSLSSLFLLFSLLFSSFLFKSLLTILVIPPFVFSVFFLLLLYHSLLLYLIHFLPIVDRILTFLSCPFFLLLLLILSGVFFFSLSSSSSHFQLLSFGFHSSYSHPLPVFIIISFFPSSILTVKFRSAD